MFEDKKLQKLADESLKEFHNEEKKKEIFEAAKTTGAKEKKSFILKPAIFASVGSLLVVAIILSVIFIPKNIKVGQEITARVPVTMINGDDGNIDVVRENDSVLILTVPSSFEYNGITYKELKNHELEYTNPDKLIAYIIREEEREKLIQSEIEIEGVDFIICNSVYNRSDRYNRIFVYSLQGEDKEQYLFLETNYQSMIYVASENSEEEYHLGNALDSDEFVYNGITYKRLEKDGEEINNLAYDMDRRGELLAYIIKKDYYEYLKDLWQDVDHIYYDGDYGDSYRYDYVPVYSLKGYDKERYLWVWYDVYVNEDY